MNNLFKRRHSGRSYDPKKTVSQAQLKEVLEATRWSLSCFGDEPWRYIVGIKGHKDGAYDKLLSCLAEANQAWAKNAPILIVSVACETFSKTKKFNRWAQYDTGASAISLCFEAVDLGLMAHQMGGFDDKKMKEIFHIPEDCVPMAVIALGYEMDNAPDKNASRTRKPLSENFFQGKWGEAISFD
ncbi:MAG: nitroreductase family protein [Alphaproteobacteria bacterium]